MTTIQEVADVLSNMKDNELAQNWLNNEIIKIKLAISYDAWLDDIDDHKLYLTLKEHIETCLDEPRYVGID